MVGVAVTVAGLVERGLLMVTEQHVNMSGSSTQPHGADDLRRRQRLHPRQLFPKGIAGLGQVLVGLPAQKIAIGQAEQSAQAQIGFGADAALAQQDLVEPGQGDACGLGHGGLG